MKKKKVDTVLLRELAPTHGVAQLAERFQCSEASIYSYLRNMNVKCYGMREEKPVKPTEIPIELHDKIRRMYSVGHPPGAIAVLLGYSRLKVCNVLGVETEY